MVCVLGRGGVARCGAVWGVRRWVYESGVGVSVCVCVRVCVCVDTMLDAIRNKEKWNNIERTREMV